MQFDQRFVSHALNLVQNYHVTRLKISLLLSCNLGLLCCWYLYHWVRNYFSLLQNWCVCSHYNSRQIQTVQSVFYALCIVHSTWCQSYFFEVVFCHWIGLLIQDENNLFQLCFFATNWFQIKVLLSLVCRACQLLKSTKFKCWNRQSELSVPTAKNRTSKT